MMKIILSNILSVVLILSVNHIAQSQTMPDEITFVRQGVRRMVFNEDQSILLARLEPDKIVGLPVMHPVTIYSDDHAKIRISDDQLLVQSRQETRTGIWFGGFNPFATYTIDLASCAGEGEIGFEFSAADMKEQFFITVGFKDTLLTGLKVHSLLVLVWLTSGP